MQILFNGLINGLAIALLAVAFQLVYLPTRIFFIGIAALYSITPYLYLAVIQQADFWPLAVGASLLGVAVLAILFEKYNHGPLNRAGASDAAHLISSLGLYIVIVELVAMVWGNTHLRLRSDIDGVTRLGGLSIADSQLIVLVVAAISLAAFFLILRGTTLGLRLRAMADNPNQFALLGYDLSLHRLIVFGLSSVLAGLASLLTARDIGFSPHAGLPAMLLAVVAVIVGGRNSFTGVVLGALLIGVIRAEVTWYLSGRWQEAATFLLLALFLILRPQGLLGRKSRMEAAV